LKISQKKIPGNERTLADSKYNHEAALNYPQQRKKLHKIYTTHKKASCLEAKAST
jgi:hypothetical protein